LFVLALAALLAGYCCVVVFCPRVIEYLAAGAGVGFIAVFFWRLASIFIP
jgi:hypothetical protein